MTTSPLPYGPDYGFGVYVHWPYCTRICPYCDFNVYAAKDRDTGPLMDAILTDLEAQATHLQDHPPLTSLFLGGGTPSLMTPPQIEQIISSCDRIFGLKPDCEITLEANPNNISKTALHDWKQIGVNRLSIGLQSLQDAALTFLGRDHTASDAHAAVTLALEAYEAVSIDMIYARPGQSLVSWETELRAALSLGAPHLSLYELTIAPGTAFAHAVKRGSLAPLPDEQQAQLYELTDSLTQSEGLPAYEVSNHARHTAAHSRHNMIYWQSGDWLGVGPGAHGRLTHGGNRYATEALLKPDAYIQAVRSDSEAYRAYDRLTNEDILHELITMGLRPTQGLERTRIDILKRAPVNTKILDHLQAGGWLAASDTHISLTASGRLLADRVALELLT